jgi:hypothetical protein
LRGADNTGAGLPKQGLIRADGLTWPPVTGSGILPP